MPPCLCENPCWHRQVFARGAKNASSCPTPLIPLPSKHGMVCLIILSLRHSFVLCSPHTRSSENLLPSLVALLTMALIFLCPGAEATIFTMCLFMRKQNARSCPLPSPAVWMPRRGCGGCVGKLDGAPPILSPGNLAPSLFTAEESNEITPPPVGCKRNDSDYFSD